MVLFSSSVPITQAIFLCVLQESRKEMGSKGLQSVIMCVLILGIILEVEGKSCCKTTLARICYNVCNRRFPPPVCALGCRCKIVKGKKCPPGYPKLNLLPNSGKRKHTIFSMFHVYYISHQQELIYILADLLFISR